MTERLILDEAIARLTADQIAALINRLTEELVLRTMEVSDSQNQRMEGDAP